MFKKNFDFLCILMGIVLFPFYIFPSGTPQIAHMLFFAGACLSIFFNGRFQDRIFSKFIIILAVFVVYTFVINSIHILLWAISEGVDTSGRVSRVLTPEKTYEPLTYSLFYFFNFTIFMGLLKVFEYNQRHNKTQDFWKFIIYAITLCILIQSLIGVLQLGRQFKSSYRAILFFNNPNQLGYYAVASATLLMISFDALRKNIFLLIVGLSGSLYIAALSLSKAAIISILMLLIIFLLLSKGKLYVKLVSFGLGGALLFTIAVFDTQNITHKIERRLSGIGVQADDSLKGRAYDRLLKYPEYLAFGAGEGLRFSRFKHNAEIHSLFATVLFSYGVIGLMLLSLFIFRIFIYTGFSQLLWLFPLGAYNLTHNGIRSPLLWICIALVLCKSNMKTMQRKLL